MIIFPAELAAFRARTADPGYTALILFGTRQATTAALLVGTLSVERIAFLLTDETRDMPDEVTRLLGCSHAAHVLGLQTIYVQSEYEKLPDDQAVPNPGTQWLAIPVTLLRRNPASQGCVDYTE